MRVGHSLLLAVVAVAVTACGTAAPSADVTACRRIEAYPVVMTAPQIHSYIALLRREAAAPGLSRQLSAAITSVAGLVVATPGFTSPGQGKTTLRTTGLHALCATYGVRS